MGAIKVLQLGPQDLSEVYEVHESAKWFYEPDFEEKEPEGDYDLILLCRNVSAEEAELLDKHVRTYCLYLLDTVQADEPTKAFLEKRLGKILESEKLKDFIEYEIRFFYSRPYGEKSNPHHMAINPGFDGQVIWNGYSSLNLQGDYGREYGQIVYWRYNMPLSKGDSLDLWLEYEKDASVDIQFKVTLFAAGTVSDIKAVWIYDEKELEDILFVENNECTGYMFMEILAKGTGRLKVIALHDRVSRKDKGHFIVGGERYVTSKREELFCYFDPGDRKPPLNVYFSGYKTQEGFEGYYMLRNLGCPFLLVSEARLEGGAFYLGSDEYENMVEKALRKYIDFLGFDRSQVNFSGLSMGTFGALYYGAAIRPGNIIIGKPLASLGDMAYYERLQRPGGFPTSLDIVWKLYDNNSGPALNATNRRFWERFDEADWSQTRFIMSYMYEDDYDTTAYQTLLSHLRGDEITVFGKGLHGRHNDDTNGIVGWFLKQYKKVLSRDFGRDV